MCAGGSPSRPAPQQQPAPAASAVAAANVSEVVAPILGTNTEDDVLRRAKGKKNVRIQLGGKSVSSGQSAGLAV